MLSLYKYNESKGGKRMGQKDITEKMLADYNDVFADIVNVLLFDGKQVIGADSLENVKDKSQYKAASQIHEE